MYKLKASEVVELARYYKNWQEKRRIGTREQMWNFHWAAGSKNYTIWAILYKEYTGANYQGQAWCAMYGTDIVALAFAKKYPELTHDQIVSLTKEFYGGDMPYNCQLFVNHHKNDSKMDRTPKVGDPVIFWTGEKYGHWGIVSKVDSNGKGFTSVEGNTSGGADKIDPDGGAVVEKWHSLTGKEYFYHPDYEPETEAPKFKTYKIGTGLEGLRVTASSLNIRETPGSNGKKIGTYKLNDRIFPYEKTFIGHTAWYHTDRGWFSAMYVEGWVLEDCAKWWWINPGYTFTVNDWQKINGKWYFFDNTGYMVEGEWIEWKGNWYYMRFGGEMATNAYIKSVAEDKYYWVGADGIWYQNKPGYTTTHPNRSMVVE